MNTELLLGGVIGVFIGCILIMVVYPPILRWLERRSDV